MRRRRGITLIEVLVAIFIMSIGLLAILTLFPLGAMRMGQALQADRTAAAASAAASICDSFGIRQDGQFDPPLIPPGPAYSPQLVAPGQHMFATSPTTGFPPASQIGQGFPIYVDPWGVLANGSNPATVNILGASTATAPATPGIWRVSPSTGAPPALFPAAGILEANGKITTVAARYFQLPDDMSFLDNATPDLSTGFIQRGGRYTYGLLLRRQGPYAPGTPVDLTIVVYSGRATSVAGGENTYSASGNINDTAVTLSYAGTQPTISRGSWVLDTSYNPLTSSVHGDFYRVVSVTQPLAGVLNLELQIPLAKPLTALTVMDNVVEVFERGTSDSTQWEFRNGQ